MLWSSVSFASWSTLSFPSMPQWLGIQQKRTCVPLSLNNQRRFMIWQIKGFSVFALYRLQAGHWVRVDHHIVVNWAHVLVIVQCQGDGCSLSSKYGAVVWQSFRQVAASCLTIQEMAVDDCRCPHSLVHFGAISIDFITWSSSFMILIELSLGFMYGDHTFAHSFNEVVSLRIIIVCSRWKAGYNQGADRFDFDLRRGHGCLYLETNRIGWRWRHAPLPFGLGTYSSLVVPSNSCRAWCAGLSMQARVFI